MTKASTLDPRTTSTILAALRYWQDTGMKQVASAYADIASDCDTHVPLSYAEIDVLCQELNAPDAAADALSLNDVTEEDERNSYSLAPDAQHCWVIVDSISAYIKRTGEGVLVDLFATGAENQSLDCAAAMFNDAEEELCKEVGVDDIDEVAKWALKTHNIVLDDESTANRADWIHRYAKVANSKDE